MKQRKFSIRKRLKSFSFAFNGLRLLLKEEHNSWIHLSAAICVVIAGFVFNISAFEWIAIVFAIGLVITLELINSSIENIADFVSPDKHDKIKKVKDLAAAAVLISAVTALVVGLIVFIPKILDFWEKL
ncbi:MAG: diacylglycerol kinase family protein [Bacteroidales bacterium]|nr:diacylglycerol kinase family protein [Bacteroidales bacterium]